MIFYWTRLTIVATWMTGIAVLAMLVPFKPLPTEHIRMAAFAFALLGPVLGFAYHAIMMTAARKAKDETKRLKRLIRQPD
jgi:hypothetical protein